MADDNEKRKIAQSMTKFWNALNEEQQEELVNKMHIEYPNPKEVFFRKGEEPLYLHYVIKGSAAIYQDVDPNRQHLVRMVEPGAIFGMQAAFASEYYKYTAIAGEDTVVAFIPITLVFHFIWESPDFALTFIQELSSLLGTSVQHTIHLTQKHIRGRLAESILRMKEKYGTEADGQTLPIYLSRSNLSMMSNMTTSNAIRTLSAFHSEGLIDFNGRKIKVLNEEELRFISANC